MFHIQINTMAKDIDEQLKLAHRVVDVVDQPNRKICVTFLCYNVDKPEISYPQIRYFAGNKEEEGIQHNLHENYKLDEKIDLDVMTSDFEKVNADQSNCNLL